MKPFKISISVIFGCTFSVHTLFETPNVLFNVLETLETLKHVKAPFF